MDLKTFYSMAVTEARIDALTRKQEKKQEKQQQKEQMKEANEKLKRDKAAVAAFKAAPYLVKLDHGLLPADASLLSSRISEGGLSAVVLDALAMTVAGKTGKNKRLTADIVVSGLQTRWALRESADTQENIPSSMLEGMQQCLDLLKVE